MQNNLSRSGIQHDIERPLESVAIIGAGAAGLITALTLRRTLPNIPIFLVYSSRIGTIGVGEGTTFSVPQFLHGYLGIPFTDFCKSVNPTFKLGIRFYWGPRQYFHYSFSREMTSRYADLSMPSGYYAYDSDQRYSNLNTAPMEFDRLLPMGANRGERPQFGYHFRNDLWTAYLFDRAEKQGISFVDGVVSHSTLKNGFLESLTLENGALIKADLFIDSSGSKFSLLEKSFNVPFVDYSNNLFCDSAIVCPTLRNFEPIRPYTTIDTMPSGWLWRTEHYNQIAMGYVYSSAFEKDAESKLISRCPGNMSGIHS